MTKKIILFNGPPGSGKDFAAKFVAKEFANVRLDKFARILKERTHALYGFPWRSWEYYEDCKEVPTDDFFGLTPRQAYINVSETYFKPVHNERIFGEMLLKEVKEMDWDILAISDSGFVEEAEVLMEEYGAENTMLVRINREGHDFTNDSRSYLELPGVSMTVTMANDGTEEFTEMVYDLVDQFVNGAKESVHFDLDLSAAINTPGHKVTVGSEPFLTISSSKAMMFPEAREYHENDAKPAVLAEYIPNIQNIKYDENDTKKDYVFEDVINGKPSLFKRFTRLINRLTSA